MMMYHPTTAAAAFFDGYYDDGFDGQPEVLLPPNNFGLSKRGLLQIDYSFNWNNLYRFITSGH